MDADFSSADTYSVVAMKVRAKNWTRKGIQIALPDKTVYGDSNGLGLGRLQMPGGDWVFRGYSVTPADNPDVGYSLGHGFFQLPNVVVAMPDERLGLVLQPGGGFESSTLEASVENECVGHFKLSRLQSRCDVAIDCRIPVEAVIIAIWCIMMRDAFGA